MDGLFSFLRRFFQRPNKSNEFIYFLLKVYELRDRYAVPFFNLLGPNGGVRWTKTKPLKISLIYKICFSTPHRLTPTSLILLWIHKLHNDPSDKLLGVQFGFTSGSSANMLFKNFVHFVYEVDDFLVLSRNLSQPGYVTLLQVREGALSWPLVKAPLDINKLGLSL